MTDHEKKRPKRHLKPVRESQRATTHTKAIAATSISWPSTWAGIVVSMGTLVFLGALGIGLNVGKSAGPEALSPNTIWAGSALVIAMFIGGYVASSRQSNQSYSRAAWHGIVFWGLAITGGVVLMGLGGNVLIEFLRAVFIPQAATTTGAIIASFTILMLGSAILGAITGAWQPSGRRK